MQLDDVQMEKIQAIIDDRNQLREHIEKATKGAQLLWDIANEDIDPTLHEMDCPAYSSDHEGPRCDLDREKTHWAIVKADREAGRDRDPDPEECTCSGPSDVHAAINELP